MADFWKASVLVVLTVILGTAIGRTEKDISVVLSAAACCMVALTAVHYFSEVVTFLWQLSASAEEGSRFLEPLLKITGVAILTELTCLISGDAGNASLGKSMQILGNAVILNLSLPVFEALIAVVQEMLRMV